LQTGERVSAKLCQRDFVWKSGLMYGDREDFNVKALTNLSYVLVIVLLMVWLVPVAQSQGPGHGGFGWNGFGPGRRGGGPFISSQGPAFQATYTRTRQENVVNSGTASTITSVVSGMIARGSDGSTYVSETRPARSGVSSTSGATSETAFIKNVTAMKNYVLNITKQTYEEFSLKSRTPGNAPPHNRPNNAPAPVAYNFKDSASGFTCAAEETKSSHTIQPPAGPSGTSNPSIVVTDDRIYCPALSAVVQETHTDPRFGSTTYVLSGITTGAPSASFTPPANYALTKRRNFGRPNPRGNTP
jgi:hypothetical protein